VHLRQLSKLDFHVLNYPLKRISN